MDNMMDIGKLTAGRFEPRITDEGAPVAFRRKGDLIVVVREKGKNQTVNTETGIGLVAACRRGGDVLGYGTLDLDDLATIADAVDGLLGPKSGTALERLAQHDILLAAPLDAMPAELRDMFLAGMVPSGLVADTAIDDEIVGIAMSGGEDHSGHDHHHHRHGEECAACSSPDSMDEVRMRVEQMIADSGHAVISVPPSEEHAGMTYSIGLIDGGWPELLITGIVGNQGVMIINAVVEKLRCGDSRPTAGMTIEQAVSVPLRLRAVDIRDSGPYARVARERHHRTGSAIPFEAIQILWPDAAGRFPDEDGYDGRGLPHQVLVGVENDQ